jgi:cellulose synthase/poly-beta-1,6-N-acetylglucosamine synthase-like glycosyltransferase
LNTLELEWPRELLEIIVVSDASTDGTETVAQEVGLQGVTVISLPSRVGKHACQGVAVKQCNAEIVVFTDVSTSLEPNSLRLLLRAFADARVGCVSGVDRAIASNGVLQGENLYVRYEMALRDLEVRAGSLVSASGCFFAVRREHCREWVNDLTSDFALPLSLGLRGMRTVCERDAHCTYRVLQRPEAEFDRKVRTVVHGLQVVRRFRACLNPFRTGFFAVQLLSHKVMRWTLPFMLVGVFVASFALLDSGPVYWALLAIKTTILACAAIGLLAPVVTRFAVVRWSLFAIMSSIAIILAWQRAFATPAGGVWEPTRR